VETHGVGYDVAISGQRFRRSGGGAEVALHIHTHVREDALSLTDSLRLAEKQLFEKLLTVSGIGPTLAIKILSGMARDEMTGAIRGGDLARLTRIPGIRQENAGAHGAGTARQAAGGGCGRNERKPVGQTPWRKM